MADDTIEVVLDDDEYMYPKPGESNADFEARMADLSRKLDARMSDTEKEQVAELMRDFEFQTA